MTLTNSLTTTQPDHKLTDVMRYRTGVIPRCSCMVTPLLMTLNTKQRQAHVID